MTEPLSAEEVERAREYSARWGPANMMFGEYRYLATIDALTAHLRLAKQVIDATAKAETQERARAEAAEAERDRLQELFDRLAGVGDEMAAMREQAVAQRDRYKAALEEIARLVPITGASSEGLARRALAPTTEGTE